MVSEARPADPKRLNQAEWQKRLDPEAYRVLREGATERAFTSKYWNHKGDGVYRCGACGEALFDSQTKYDSGSGWPSFTEPRPDAPVEERPDPSHGMARTEVRCNKCGSHLGHVFDDGPQPTGQRYCINSCALIFEEREE